MYVYVCVCMCVYVCVCFCPELLQSLENMPCTLQTLFYTTKGKLALAGFLSSTEIYTIKWLSKGREEEE